MGPCLEQLLKGFCVRSSQFKNKSVTPAASHSQASAFPTAEPERRLCLTMLCSVCVRVCVMGWLSLEHAHAVLSLSFHSCRWDYVTSPRYIKFAKSHSGNLRRGTSAIKLAWSRPDQTRSRNNSTHILILTLPTPQPNPFQYLTATVCILVH